MKRGAVRLVHHCFRRLHGNNIDSPFRSWSMCLRLFPMFQYVRVLLLQAETCGSIGARFELCSC